MNNIKKKYIRAIIFVLLTISIVGCKKEGKNCPAFPPEMLGYFPYSEGDTLEFTNTNNDTLILNISRFRVTDRYTIEPNSKCVCSSDAGFSTDDKNNYEIQFNGTLIYSVNDSNFTLQCQLRDGIKSSDNFEISKVINSPYSIDFMDTFGDTIFMMSYYFYRYDSVKVIKNKGVVEFWDKKCSCEWIISE